MIFTTLLMLALVGDAHASRATFPGAGPGLVKTKVGTFPKSTIQAFCDADRIVIGEIDQVQSFYHASGKHKHIMSHASFLVAQSLRAETRSSLHLVLSGGRIGEDVRAPASGLIAPVVGTRIALAYYLAPDKSGYIQKNDPLVAAHLYINTDESHDPNAVTSFFKNFQEEYCE